MLEYLKKSEFTNDDLHVWLKSGGANGGANKVEPNIFEENPWGSALLTHARSKQRSMAEEDPAIELDSLVSFLQSLVDVKAQRAEATKQFLLIEWKTGDFKNVVPDIMNKTRAMGMPTDDRGWQYTWEQQPGTENFSVVSKLQNPEGNGGAVCEEYFNSWLVQSLENIVSVTTVGHDIFQRVVTTYDHATLGKGAVGFARAYFYEVLEMVKVQAAGISLTGKEPAHKAGKQHGRTHAALLVHEGGERQQPRTPASEAGVLAKFKAMVPVTTMKKDKPMHAVLVLYMRSTEYHGPGCHYCGGFGHAPFSTKATDWEKVRGTTDISSLFTCKELVKALQDKGWPVNNTADWIIHPSGGSMLGKQPIVVPKPRQQG